MNIEPLGARVLILPIEGESQTPGGILLPETAKEKPQQGMI
ncbi:MAG: co-chaperone GroES, partial [Chloroflexi bacterium]